MSPVLPVTNRSAIDRTPLSSSPSPAVSTQETDKTHAYNDNVTTSRTWLFCFIKNNAEPLSPEAEYEQLHRRQVTSKAVYFTAAASTLVASCVGAGLSVIALKQSLAEAAHSTEAIEDFLHGKTDEAPDTANDEDFELASTVSLYLTAICFFALVLSFLFTVLLGGRLALVVHYRSMSKLADAQKQNEEPIFWKRMYCIFGTRHLRIKKPTLPTYGHAVRQAVLKHGARQGNPQMEFHRISMEEMELERIRKLGGAPPSYTDNAMKEASTPSAS